MPAALLCPIFSRQCSDPEGCLFTDSRKIHNIFALFKFNDVDLLIYLLVELVEFSRVVVDGIDL
jgi:hypothetical protein